MNGPKKISLKNIPRVNMEEFRKKVNEDIKAGKYRNKNNHYFPEMNERSRSGHRNNNLE